ncbi:MAG: M23 family metallopeptidase [Anaerolineales bacterium]|nr:M23 family metallopeptidase [Anaerolineales bacterium]
MKRLSSLCLLLGLLLSCTSPAATPAPPPTIPTVAQATAVLTATPSPTAVPSATLPPPTVTQSPTATPQPVCDTPAAWGGWCFETNLFVHPIALTAIDDVFYLLDGGRVLALTATAPPQTLLRPQDTIGGTVVIEPLDLTAVGRELLVLDRAGDVYRYDTQTQQWAIDRYDRLIEETSSHYFVALTTAAESRFLIEASYYYGIRYEADGTEAGWTLPEAYYIDVAADREDEQSVAYVLTRPFGAAADQLTRFYRGQPDKQFIPALEIRQGRELVLTDNILWLLDQAGQRLTALNRQNGQVLEQVTLPVAISSFWAAADGSQLILAGRDTLYFVDEPAQNRVISGGEPFSGRAPHDPAVLASLTGLLIPTSGAAIADRDLRMPGAPRHYRLGVHEGVDFYWSPGKAVLATAAGTVIRAETAYQPPSEQAFANQRAEAREVGYTPEDILDFYRGRQVWLEHDNGLISRYAHLSAIADGLTVGQPVAAGEIIGEVGNSGSPASLEGPTADAHLHFELWLGDYYVGQFLRPIETREWLAQILE